jgi:signal transduction histidine kinase
MVQDMRRLNLDISQLNTELESMNRTKTDFISITSHELRTPLSQVNGYSEILAEELGPASPLADFVDGLLQGSARLTEIIEVMLDVSRLDAGALTLKRTSVNLNQVIERAVDEWTPALDERGHTLITDGVEVFQPVD